jgi:membrane-associated HD superfamily phosphohydrolase
MYRQRERRGGNTRKKKKKKETWNSRRFLHLEISIDDFLCIHIATYVWMKKFAPHTTVLASPCVLVVVVNQKCFFSFFLFWTAVSCFCESSTFLGSITCVLCTSKNVEHIFIKRSWQNYSKFANFDQTSSINSARVIWANIPFKSI